MEYHDNSVPSTVFQSGSSDSTWNYDSSANLDRNYATSSSFSNIHEGTTSLYHKYGARDCEYCGLSTESYSDYKMHIKEHRLKDGSYQCPRCSYATKLRSSMINHVRRHTGAKPYSCKYCSYRAAQKSSLDKHLTVHMKNKPIFCRYCPYRATHMNDLSCHVLTNHPGES